MNTNDSPNSAQAASLDRETLIEVESYLANNCTGSEGCFPDTLHAKVKAALVQFETTPGVDAPGGLIEVNPPLAVTDADRSEAADLLLIVGFSLEYIAETKAGSHDDHAFVQAFARHRLATQTPNAAALVGALDLAKRMAESVGLDWSKLPDEPDAACGYGMPEGCKSYWLRLAALSSTPSNTQGALEAAARDAVLEEAARRADYEAELAQDNLNESYDIKSNRPALRIAKRIGSAIRNLKSGEAGLS